MQKKKNLIKLLIIFSTILIIIGIISIIGISYLIKKYKSKFGILKIN